MRFFTTLTLLCALSSAPIALAAGLPQDATPAERLAAMRPPEPYSKVKIAPESKLDAIELATFSLSNGSTVTLLAVPEFREIGYVELVEIGAESILPSDEMSPLEVFLALAPSDTPVPRALIDLDIKGTGERLAAGRTRTDLLSEPIAVAVEDLGFPVRLATKATSSCGSGGAQYFASNYCGPPVSPVNHAFAIEFCDANYNGGDSVWFNLTRNSYSGGWKMRPRSYGRTAACGTSVEIKQQYWVSGAWVNLSTQLMQSGQVYISAWQGPDAYRRIIRSRQTGSGGFRAYSDFYIYYVPVP